MMAGEQAQERSPELPGVRRDAPALESGAQLQGDRVGADRIRKA